MGLRLQLNIMSIKNRDIKGDLLMMNSKQKGARGEREFASLCRNHGYDVRRTQQYCGNTGDAADVVGLPGMHIEVKRVEKLNIGNAMAQAVHDAAKNGVRPIVAHRKNNCEWLITMRACDWFDLYRKWECSWNQEKKG